MGEMNSTSLPNRFVGPKKISTSSSESSKVDSKCSIESGEDAVGGGGSSESNSPAESSVQLGGGGSKLGSRVVNVEVEER